jgi:hypothetical protein
MNPRTLASIALAAALLATPARAQMGGSGSIQGTVLDSSGGIVVGASVVATNVDTGVEAKRVTNKAGLYVISPLTAGTYTVTVSSKGFKSIVQNQVVVDANATAAVNATLSAGLEEEVTVADIAPPINTTDARLGTTVRSEVYSALPLVMPNGGPRNPISFMFLQPGMQNIGRWGNAMGGQDFTNEVYVDGVAITNATTQGEGRNLSFGVSVEAIDQFQVETSGTAVSFGGQGSSNFVIKSGGNDLKGAVYSYLRGSGLDAPGFFALRDASGAKIKPETSQKEFGFTLSGPIRKNKVFFFVSYAGYRDTRETQPQLTTIPTLAFRNGDFSALLPTIIYDPATTRPNPGGTGFIRDPFPGNIIPPSRISPQSKFFQSLLPQPINSSIANNYSGSLPTGFQNDSGTVKLDASLTAKHQVSLLLSHGKNQQATSYTGGQSATGANVVPLPYTNTRLVEQIPSLGTLKHTYLLGSRMVNQLSLGASRLEVPIINATIDGDWGTKGGLTGLPAGEAASSFPEVTFNGPNVPVQWRGTDSRAFYERLWNYSLTDNLQMTFGRHSVTAGLQYQRLISYQRERSYGSLVAFTFSNNQTAGFNAAGTLNTASGNAYASYLLGEVNTTSIIEDAIGETKGIMPTYAVWLQDNFKVTTRLALNLGLRYDLMKPYTEAEDRWSFLNPTLPNPAVGGFPGALQFAGYGPASCQCETPVKTYYGMIQPRLGVAYQLSEKLVARAAYGIMHTRRGAVGGRAGTRNGTGLLGYAAQPTFQGSTNFAPAYNWTTGIPAYQKPPFFDATLNTGFNTVAGATAGGVTLADADIGGIPPRFQNFNVGVQYALGQKVTVGLNYAGSRGSHLGGGGRGKWSNQIDPKYLALGNLLSQNASAATIATARASFPEIALPYANFVGTIAQMLRPFPQYASVGDPYGDVASSAFNSLQFTLEVRRWHGLLWNMNYMLSKQMDDTGSIRSAYRPEIEWSVGVNDQTHIFNSTFVYQVPLGKDHKLGGGSALGRSLLSGWEISGITQFSSGRPIGPIAAACNLPQAGTCYADFNPSFTGPVRINGDWGDGDIRGATPVSYIDRNAFQSPAAYNYGNTPRTLPLGLRLPNNYNQDISLRRIFTVRKDVRLSLGVDAFNVFNNVIFGGINANITSAAFGRVSSQLNTPRVLQVKARIEF